MHAEGRGQTSGWRAAREGDEACGPRPLRAAWRLQPAMWSLVALTACLGAAGCWLPYAVSVGCGELNVLLHARPIEQVLAEGDLTPEETQKLRYLLEVRRYAVETIGLDAGESFTTFVDTSVVGDAYNLSAAAKTSLTPVTWTFPLVGSLPYIGFFDRDQAEACRDQLVSAGYDTFLYEVDAYSTLGLFADPVRRSMLRRDEIDLADVVIHELTHNTIWRPGDTDFNESLATFVGRAGALAFLAEHFGPDSSLVASAEDRFADRDRFNRFLSDLYAELAAFYASDIPTAEKLEQREQIYQAARDRFATEELPQFHSPEDYAWAADLPTNNALLLAFRRYNLDLELFAAVHEAAGGAFDVSLPVFAAAANQPDPKAFLRAWLSDHPAE